MSRSALAAVMAQIVAGGGDLVGLPVEPRAFTSPALGYQLRSRRTGAWLQGHRWRGGGFPERVWIPVQHLGSVFTGGAELDAALRRHPDLESLAVIPRGSTLGAPTWPQPQRRDPVDLAPALARMAVAQ